MAIWKTSLTAMLIAPAMVLTGTTLNAQIPVNLDRSPDVARHTITENVKRLMVPSSDVGHVDAKAIKVDPSLTFPTAATSKRVADPAESLEPDQTKWFPAKPRQAPRRLPVFEGVAETRENGREDEPRGRELAADSHRFSELKVFQSEAGKDNPFTSHPPYRSSSTREDVVAVPKMVRTDRDEFKAPRELPRQVSVATATLPEPEIIPDLMTASTPLQSTRENECSVEVVPNENNGYHLQLSVPESVDAVEVVRGGSQKPIQISLDEDRNVKPEPVLAQVPRPALAQVQGGREGKSRYKINPFFNASAVAATTHAVGRESIGEPKIGLTKAQLPVSNSKVREPRYSRQTRPETPPKMAEAPVDIRRLSSLLHPPTVDATAMEGPLPISIHPLGPASMATKGTADFSIEVKNDSDVTIRDFDLRLSLPEGMVVKVLDRPAEYNAQYHTVTWKLEKLEKGASTMLRYRVESTQEGRHIQAFEIGAGNQFGQPTTFSTSAFE